MKEIKTILINTTTKTTTIQTLAKALTNPYKNNKQHSNYHPQLHYTLTKENSTILIRDKTASAKKYKRI